MKSRSRYIMIGGFLGAGKTTSIQKFAEHLDGKGLTVGLITNDQGAGLVDSSLARSKKFPVEEISGGCFCCRFNSLIEAAKHLSAATRPDVLLAEPVGSCTDLVATVSLPLQKIYGEDYQVAPLSVLVDPIRARRVLGLGEGKRFSENVRYIYGKQLEEAEIIVVNKSELLSDAERIELLEALGAAYPGAEVRVISAREGTGLEGWFAEVCEREMDVTRFMEVDYQRYGEGEALLGWLNTTLELRGSDDGEEEFDGNDLLLRFAEALRKALASEGFEIAHLKMTLTPIGDPYEIGAVNLVRSDQAPESSHTLSDDIEDGELILNIRAEADPEALDRAVSRASDEILRNDFGLEVAVTHAEHFRPGKPVPTHRYNKI